MKTIFEDTALEELMYWVRENRKNAVKIYKLIQDIQRNGMDKGEGKPEHLKIPLRLEPSHRPNESPCIQY